MVNVFKLLLNELIIYHLSIILFFFFNDTATTEIYTLSLHDALPICCGHARFAPHLDEFGIWKNDSDRKSTRLNSSHVSISYAVFCLKKKKINNNQNDIQ